MTKKLLDFVTIDKKLKVAQLSHMAFKYLLFKFLIFLF